MAGKKKVFYIVAKNLSADNSLKKLMSTDLVILTDDYQYSPFLPKSALDFKLKTEYGRIVEEAGRKFMVRHYILAMAETELERDEIIDGKGKRLSNPARKSLTPAKQELSLFTLASEKLTIGQDKRAKKVVQHATGAEILNRYAKSVNSSKSNRGTGEKHIPQAKKDKDKTSSSEKSSSSSSAKISQKLGESSKSSTSEKISSAAEIPEKADKVESSEQQASLSESRACNNCKTLQKQNDMLTIQIDNCEGCRDWEVKYNKLAKRVKAFEEQAASNSKAKDVVMEVARDLGEQMKSQLANTIPDLILKSQTGVSLKGITSVCSDDEEDPGKIPEGMVKVDTDLFIPMKKIESIERNFFKFTLRVNKLCDLVWKNEAHKHFFDKKANEGGHLIPLTLITSMTKLLEKMKWTTKVDVTVNTVREQVRKYTSYCRALVREAALPVEEKRKKREDKKLARKKEGTKKKFVIENRKRKFVDPPTSPQNSKKRSLVKRIGGKAKKSEEGHESSEDENSPSGETQATTDKEVEGKSPEISKDGENILEETPVVSDSDAEREPNEETSEIDKYIQEDSETDFEDEYARYEHSPLSKDMFGTQSNTL